MGGIRFIYEIIGLIVAAGLLAMLTRPSESDLSRVAFDRHKKKRKKKARFETRRTEAALSESTGTNRDIQAATDGQSTDLLSAG